MQFAALNHLGIPLIQERSWVKQLLSEELCYMSNRSLLRKEVNC